MPSLGIVTFCEVLLAALISTPTSTQAIVHPPRIRGHDPLDLGNKDGELRCPHNMYSVFLCLSCKKRNFVTVRNDYTNKHQ